MYAVVLLSEHTQVYGPFRDRRTADRFAAFLTDEVDPAGVFPLTDPSTELLNWRDHVHAKSLDAVDRMAADAMRSPNERALWAMVDRATEPGSVTRIHPRGAS